MKTFTTVKSAIDHLMLNIDATKEDRLSNARARKFLKENDVTAPTRKEILAKKPIDPQAAQEAAIAKFKASNPEAAKKANAMLKASESANTATLAPALYYTAAGYSKLGENHAMFSAYTIAAHVHAGYLSENIKPIAKGNLGMLKMLCKPRMIAYWSTMHNEARTALAKGGLDNIASRLAGTSKGYNTTIELVSQALDHIRNGGIWEMNGIKIPFYAVKAKKA